MFLFRKIVFIQTFILPLGLIFSLFGGIFFNFSPQVIWKDKLFVIQAFLLEYAALVKECQYFPKRTQSRYQI